LRPENENPGKTALKQGKSGSKNRKIVENPNPFTPMMLTRGIVQRFPNRASCFFMVILVKKIDKNCQIERGGFNIIFSCRTYSSPIWRKPGKIR